MARAVFVFVWCLCCAALTISAAPAQQDDHQVEQHQDVQRVASPDGSSNQKIDVSPETKTIRKRSAAPESNHDDYPDYLLGVKYDEYPMIVPKKRAALLIDRLMVALQKAIEDEEGRGVGPRTKTYSLRSDDGVRMDLQRRGHQSVTGQKNGRYWRCYFNAVTCF